MENYVKGEWRLNNYHHPYQYIVAHGGIEDNDAFPGQRKICDIWDWNTEKGKSNACLIASAPLLKEENKRLNAENKMLRKAILLVPGANEKEFFEQYKKWWDTLPCSKKKEGKRARMPDKKEKI